MPFYSNRIEDIVAFVRKVRGDEKADAVANDADALDFWDQKLDDCASDPDFFNDKD